MNKSSIKNYHILKQVPVDYYFAGIKNNPLQSLWHKRKWAVIQNLLKEGSGTLLDIGCADGTTTHNISLASPKLKVTGVDLYKETIDFAKKKYPDINFIFADAQKMPLKSGSFNYVCAIEILEHLENPDTALEEIKRVLGPGGTLIVGQDTDSLLFKFIWWFWGRYKGSVWKNSHINCERPEKLLKRIKKHGFKIKNTRFHNLNMEIFITAEKA